MTALDREPFAMAIGVLAEAFNEPVSPLRTEAYFAALEDFPLPHVLHGIARSLRGAKFFPRPAEILEAIEGNPEQLADEQWGCVMDQVRRVGYMERPTFKDPLVLPTIGRLWGSWRAMCETLPAGGPELVGWIKQFKAVYVRARVAGEDRSRLPELTQRIVAQVSDIAQRKAMPLGDTIQTDLEGRPLWQGAHAGRFDREDDES